MTRRCIIRTKAHSKTSADLSHRTRKSGSRLREIPVDWKTMVLQGLQDVECFLEELPQERRNRSRSELFKDLYSVLWEHWRCVQRDLPKHAADAALSKLIAQCPGLPHAIPC